MKKILLALLLLTTTGSAAITEVDKALFNDRNLILNPGFENGKSKWVTSSATLTATTTAANVLTGVASGSILIASNGGYARTSSMTLPKGLYGKACEVRVNYRNGDALTTLEVYNANNTLLGSQALTLHAVVGAESAFFPCPSATDVAGDANKGIVYAQIRQTSAGTHAVMYTDDWYLGQLSMLGESALPDTFNAKISSADVVSDENVDWINGNCTDAATGSQTCVFNSGIFSVAPNCSCNSVAFNDTCAVTAASSTSVTFQVGVGATGAAANTATHVSCNKASTDAKQSVQVYKSIPTITSNINDFTARVSTADVVTGENSDWINGNCTNATTGRQTCTFNSGIFTVAPNCGCVPDIGGTGAYTCGIFSVSSTAVDFYSATSTTAAATNIDTSVWCQKAGVDFKLPVVQPIFSPKGIVGSVVQSAYTQTGAVATGTTLIPIDDTIPQITEGNEYMTLAFTPLSASNLLRIRVTAQLSSNASNNLIAALFQDSTANALASMWQSEPTGGQSFPITFTHTMTAGTTSATTFRVRAGGSNASTVTFNGGSSIRQLGGVMASSISVEEIQQ